MSGSRRAEEHQRFEKRLDHKTRVKEKDIGVDSYTIHNRQGHDRLAAVAHEKKGRGAYCGSGHDDKVRTQIHVDPKRIFDLAPHVLSRQDLRDERRGRSASKEYDEEKNGEVDKMAGKLEGLVILCNKRTKSRILSHQAFEIPLHRKKLLDKVCSGLKLFFYEVEERELFGIFEVTTYGIRETASKVVGEVAYSAVVQFEAVKICLPLRELDFKDAVWRNFLEADDVTFDLSSDQVVKLIHLFELAETPLRHSNLDRKPHSFPTMSRNVSPIDLQLPFQPLERLPEKYINEGSQLSRKELSTQVLSISTHQGDDTSYMYGDAFSLPSYLQESREPECMNSGEDSFAFKSSLDVLPSTMKDMVWGGASGAPVSGRGFYSSRYKAQAVFDKSGVEDKTNTLRRSLHFPRASLDLKGTVDCWNSTSVTARDGALANLPLSHNCTDSVSDAQKLYPGCQTNQNESLNEGKYDKMYSSRLYGFEGRDLARAYGYELRESSLSRNGNIPLSANHRSLKSDLGDTDGPKCVSRLDEGGISKLHVSTSSCSSQGYHGSTSAHMLGTGHVSLPAASYGSHPLHVAHETSPVNNRGHFKLNDPISKLPLEHVYTPKLRMPKADGIKRKDALYSSAHHLSKRVELKGEGLSLLPADESYFRSPHTEKSERLMLDPHSDTAFKTEKCEDDACQIRNHGTVRKQGSSSINDEKHPSEYKRKHKRSVWSRLSGFNTRENECFTIDDAAFLVDLKGIRSSSNLSDRRKSEALSECHKSEGLSDCRKSEGLSDCHKSEAAEELNIDFTFSDNTFLVDFKRRKNKLRAEIKDGRRNISENQQEKRRKLLRS